MSSADETRSVTILNYTSGNDCYTVTEVAYQFDSRNDEYGQLWLCKASPSIKRLDVPDSVKCHIALGLLRHDMAANQVPVELVPYCVSVDATWQEILFSDRITKNFVLSKVIGEQTLDEAGWRGVTNLLLRTAAIQLGRDESVPPAETFSGEPVTDNDPENEYDAAEQQRSLGDGADNGESVLSKCKSELFSAARNALRKGVQALKDHWNMITPVIFFMACSSQSSYQLMRLALMYNAPDPFEVARLIRDGHGEFQLYDDPEVDAHCCVKLYPRISSPISNDVTHGSEPLPPTSSQCADGPPNQSASSSVFPILHAWKREQKRMRASGEFAQQLLQLQEGVYDALEEHDIISPAGIGFVSPENVGLHGNSLVLIYNTPEEAVEVLQKFRALPESSCIQVCGCEMTAHQARNRRKKIQLGHNITAPSIQTVNQVKKLSDLMSETAGLHYFKLEKPIPDLYFTGEPLKKVVKSFSFRLLFIPVDISREDIVSSIQQHLAAVVEPSSTEYVHGIFLDSSTYQLPDRSGEALTWIVQLKNRQILDTFMNSLENKMFNICGYCVKPHKLQANLEGGVLISPYDAVKHALHMAYQSGELESSGTYIANIAWFIDGTPMRGHSVTAGKIRILSSAFKTGASKMIRVFNIVGGETQVFGQTKVYLQDEKDVARLRNLLGHNSTTMSSEFTTGFIISVEAILEHGLQKLFSAPVLVGSEGPKCTEVKFCSTESSIMYIADNKAGNNIAGVPPLNCCKCEISHDHLAERVVGGELRSLRDINTSFDNMIVDIASVIGYLLWGATRATRHWAAILAAASKVEDAVAKLGSMLAEVCMRNPSLVETKSKVYQCNIKSERQSYNTTLLAKGTSDEDCVSDEHDLHDLDVRFVKLRMFLLRYLQQANEYAELTSLLCEPELKLSNDDLTVLASQNIVANPPVALGFKGRSNGSIPISKSCFESKVLPAAKHLNGRVSHRPLDFLFPSRRRGEEPPIPLPFLIPALFHGIFSIGKQNIGIVQKLDIRGTTDLTARQAKTAHFQAISALTHQDVTSNLDDAQSISSHLNCTKIRLILNHHEAMFKDIVSWRSMRLLQLTELVSYIIYCTSAYTWKSGALYYCAARLLWVMMYRFDIIRRLKARTDVERNSSSLVQSLHVHQTLGHGPETYSELKQPLVAYTEESGESSLKKDKNFAKRSDNKDLTGSFQAMDHAEDIKLFMQLCTRETDTVKSRHAGPFQPTVVPNIVVHGCLYSLPSTQLAFMQLLISLLVLHRKSVIADRRQLAENDDATAATANLSFDDVEALANAVVPCVLIKNPEPISRDVQQSMWKQDLDKTTKRYQRFQEQQHAVVSIQANRPTNSSATVIIDSPASDGHSYGGCPCQGCLAGNQGNAMPGDAAGCICCRLPVIAFKVATGPGIGRYVHLAWCKDQTDYDMSNISTEYCEGLNHLAEKFAQTTLRGFLLQMRYWKSLVTTCKLNHGTASRLIEGWGIDSVCPMSGPSAGGTELTIILTNPDVLHSNVIVPLVFIGSGSTWKECEDVCIVREPIVMGESNDVAQPRIVCKIPEGSGHSLGIKVMPLVQYTVPHFSLGLRTGIEVAMRPVILRSCYQYDGPHVELVHNPRSTQGVGAQLALEVQVKGKPVLFSSTLRYSQPRIDAAQSICRVYKGESFHIAGKHFGELSSQVTAELYLIGDDVIAKHILPANVTISGRQVRVKVTSEVDVSKYNVKVVVGGQRSEGALPIRVLARPSADDSVHDMQSQPLSAPITRRTDKAAVKAIKDLKRKEQETLQSLEAAARMKQARLGSHAPASSGSKHSRTKPSERQDESQVSSIPRPTGTRPAPLNTLRTLSRRRQALLGGLTPSDGAPTTTPTASRTTARPVQSQAATAKPKK